MKKVFNSIILLLLLFIIFKPEEVRADGNFQMNGNTLVKYSGTDKSVIIPDYVTAIGTNAFTKNTRLETVYFPESVTTIGPGAFEYCLNLKTISLPKSLVSIDYLAFRGCDKLSNVRLPSNLNSIGADAFMQCQSITEITIPTATVFIDYGAFGGCANLKAIHVEEGNTHFREEGGILYSYDMQTLVQYPNGKNEKNIVVRDGVRRLERAAVYENYVVETIEFPDTLNSIGIYAFKDCHLLSSLELPKSLSKVEEHAFSFCYNLQDVVVLNPATSFGADVFENDANVVLHAAEESAAKSYASSKGIKFEALKEPEESSASEESSVAAEPSIIEDSHENQEKDASEITIKPTVTVTPTSTEPEMENKTVNPLLYVFMLTAALSLVGIIVVRRKLKEYEK